MQRGTEAEIKERHRQTERWVGGVGGWVWGGGGQRQREEERGKDGERGEKGRE